MPSGSSMMPPIAWATPSPRCACQLVASHRQCERCCGVGGGRAWGTIAASTGSARMWENSYRRVASPGESRSRLIDRLKGRLTSASGRVVTFGRWRDIRQVARSRRRCFRRLPCWCVTVPRRHNLWRQDRPLPVAPCKIANASGNSVVVQTGRVAFRPGNVTANSRILPGGWGVC